MRIFLWIFSHSPYPLYLTSSCTFNILDGPGLTVDHQ
jgi:hypothetical protein